MHLTHVAGELSARPLKFLETDKLVVRWIAQAAVNVELFTIPLYMTSLYSITGFHPITSQGNKFYKGRQWPGAKTSAVFEHKPGKKGWGNKKAFNIVFSVFIQEMLHLQMAANLATAVGATPSFTATALQSDNHGWTCYGPELTKIPGIVDLKDTNRFQHVAVNVGPLDKERIELFLAIEQPQETAEKDIVRHKEKYFPKVPFAYDTVAELDAHIMFGSIGYMYQCFRDYLLICYEDGTKLWDHVMDSSGQQNDLFNSFSFPGHPMREFMGFETTIAMTDPEIALAQALNMMNAITDQGEGATLGARYDNKGQRLKDGSEKLVQGAVNPHYCPSREALASDYPSYSQDGTLVPSSDAAARAENDGVDHYTRFREIEDIRGSGGLETWDQSPLVGNWQGKNLVTADYDPSSNPFGLPLPEDIANALNSLQETDTAANFEKMSQAVCGAIKGVTTVLDSYWNPGSKTVSFPFPSMSGSGDRMSTAWAVFGATPDLSVGVASANTNIVNHACQGLDVAEVDGKWGANACAQTSIYHTCRGSNLCKGQGGCGFVQATSGGGSCGGAGGSCGGGSSKTSNTPKASPVASGSCSAVTLRTYGGSCGGPTPTPTPPSSCGVPPVKPCCGTPGPNDTMYTAPSDNICGGFGGCAVPISALQLYPKSGFMEVWVLAESSKPVLCGAPKPTPSPAPASCSAVDAKAGNLCGTPTPSPTPTPSGQKKIATIKFCKGDKVEDIAFQAFAKVVAYKVNGDPDKSVDGLTQQAPSDLRLAYPPST
jgi:hypothetical protein